MKKLFFVGMFSLTAIFVSAQEAHNHGQEGHNHDEPIAITTVKTAIADENKKVDETLIPKQEVHDFGKIPQGKPVTYIFEVMNIGKTPITIGNVQASCGCTTPEWDKDKAIPAGGSAKITVGYNAAAEGPFTKPVTITYNENQTRQLTIKGEVWKTPASSAPVNESLNELKN